MIIGVDAAAAVKYQRTGTEWYAAEIIKSLLAIDKTNEYRFYSRLPAASDVDLLGTNASWKVMPFPAGWTLVRLSWEMLRRPPDVFFVPSNRLPLVTPKRSVVMVHDLSYLHVPEVYTRAQRAYHKNAVWWAKNYATHILSPSEFTTIELMDECGIERNRITTVHHGCSISDEEVEQASESDRPLAERYFYYIGRLEQKKNIVRLLKAFALFKQRTASDFKLVLTGKPGIGFAQILQAIEDLKSVKDDVVFTGYLSKSEAIRYMRHAEGFVFVSLFEGFGMPLLEAFKVETAVIAARSTCLPEIAGGAALLVDPYDEQDIARAMDLIAHDSELKSQLIEKGRVRINEFSWSRAARQTLSVLKEVASCKS